MVFQTDTDAKSWGEMLNSYRSTHGATSFATVQSGTDVPQHFPRTSLTPFGDIYHKNVHSIGADYAETRYGTEEQRHKYHGRGMNPPWMQDQKKGFNTRQGDPRHDATRMFDTMAHASNADTRADSWMGNFLVDPKVGRRHMEAPLDPKGRRDLFDVVNQRNPGKPADDSWLGHGLIDPAKGRLHNEDPAQRQGRKDLFPVIQQEALHTPALGGPAPRAKDPLGDLWIGHMKVNPRKGKARVEDVPAVKTVVDKEALLWDGRPDNVLVAQEMGKVGKRPVSKGREVAGVPALLCQDPAFPPEALSRTRRAVEPPRVENETFRHSRRAMSEQTQKIRYESHYDLHWHGGEPWGYTDRQVKTMHRPTAGQIPGLRPRGGMSLSQTRVRTNPAAKS